MGKPTPLATVKDKFGGRAELVGKLADMVDDLHDEGDSAVKSRLMGLSNKKLLRLYTIEQAVREKFGDREKLIDHLMAARKTAGLTANDDYKDKLQALSKGRLLDLSKSKLGVAAAKWTPEQKMKSKHGRKQIERAKSKLGQA